jgi:hypothetical protein
MPLGRLAGLAISDACHCVRLLWLVVAILFPFLLSQALPEQTAVPLASAPAAAWENTEDGGDGTDQDQGYPTGTPSAERLPTRLPEGGLVVVRFAGWGQTAWLVAESPRGPPQSRRDTKNRVA